MSVRLQEVRLVELSNCISSQRTSRRASGSHSTRCPFPPMHTGNRFTRLDRDLRLSETSRQMRAVVIGGTGHIGTYLIPRLVASGYEIINISRSKRAPYRDHGAWKSVKNIELDRSAEERSGKFGKQILDLRPDVVIDLICFTVESARHLVEALRGEIQHFLHCGTIWVHGPSVQVPTTEEAPRTPFGDYGIQKAAIEEYLLREARLTGFPATILHPGHIVGPGWEPLNPAGHFNPKVFERLARGEEIVLPNLGLETVHHVHADDVAQAFAQAMVHRSVAHRRKFPCGFAGRIDSPRLCRNHLCLVREESQFAVCIMG